MLNHLLDCVRDPEAGHSQLFNPGLNNAPSGFGLKDTALGPLWLWLDFSDPATMYWDAGTTLVSANAQTVQRVVAKTASNAAVTRMDQTVAGSQGTYRTNVQNGLSVLRFDGTDDSYDLTILASDLDAKFTMYFVGNVTNTAGLKYIIGGTTNAAAARFSATEVLEFNEENVANALTASAATTAGSFTLTSLVYDGADATAYNLISSNGTAAYAGTIIGSPAQIGASGAGFYFAGDMGELLIYKAAHTATQRANVWQYFRAKWGI